jgi:WD repeat-containing protein 23
MRVLLIHHHHQEPVLMSVAWSSGSRGGSVVARHEWKGLLKMPGALEDLVERRRLESQEQHAGSMSGGLDSDDEYMLESDDDEDN